LSFLLASLLAGFTAFSYAELSVRYPLSAGEVVYVEKGVGLRWLAILVGVLIIMTGIVSAATIARGFVGYLQVFVDFPGVWAIVLLVLALGVLSAWGIAESAGVAAMISLLEVAGLLLIIWVTQPSVDAAVQTLHNLSQGVDGGGAVGLFLGAFLAFYAFIGFEDMVNVAEEVRDPGRDLPRAILLALGVSTLLYFLLTFATVSTTSPAALAASDAPLAYVYHVVTGSDPWVTAISLVAVVNGALIQIIMSSRVCYGMSRRGWAPEWLGRVHPLTRTPLIATVLVTVLVMLMAPWIPIESLARATSFFILMVFTLVNLALWRIKRRPRNAHGLRGV
jgi:APA family basic amino acid/polyamine antiporter